MSVKILIKEGDECWYPGRPEMTYYFLRHSERFLSQLLKARGYLTLNDILETLYKPKTVDGNLIGLIYDETKSDTDNTVYFGLCEGTENFDKFISGENNYVYLDIGQFEGGNP